MITREEATAYLTRVTEARKVLNIPLRPEEKIWMPDNVHYLYQDENTLFISGCRKLAEALGHPYRLSHFGQNCDKISFHYNGIEVYDLTNHGHPRIGKKVA